MENKKILIAEDDRPSAELLKRILTREGYAVDMSFNGREAFDKIKINKYDALLTDWMMPEMDGIKLIKKTREILDPAPVIIIITSLSSDDACNHAMKSGADYFIIKPYEPANIINQLKELFSQKEQILPSKITIPGIKAKIDSQFFGVCIAASSGGPQTLKKMLSAMPLIDNAAFFMVQHAPGWILNDMARAWNKVSTMKIILGENGMDVKPGSIYLAPGDNHMVVSGKNIIINLLNEPAENHVKPAADPLFRSVAMTFGDKSIGVVLTGMGCDGAVGAGHIKAANGLVIAQDPKTAIVYAMPQAAIRTVSDAVVAQLSDIPEKIIAHIKNKTRKNTKSVAGAS